MGKKPNNNKKPQTGQGGNGLIILLCRILDTSSFYCLHVHQDLPAQILYALYTST